MDRPRRSLSRIGIAVIYVVALLAAIGPAQAVEAAPNPTPTPAPRPSQTPSPTPSSSPAPSREQQEEYRAYVSMLAVNSAGVVAAVIGLGACRDGRGECRMALRDARGEVKAFETDLDRTPPPPCLNGADAQIRASLGLYDRGLELVEEGSNAQERLKVIQGGILVAVASLKLGSAVRAVRKSDC